MFAGILSAALVVRAMAAEGEPVLVWKPVLQMRVGGGTEAFSLPADAPYFGVTARVGVAGSRGVLDARATLLGSYQVPSNPAGEWRASGTVATLGEAWVRWTPRLSDALGVRVDAGLLPLEVGTGSVVGNDDLELTGRFPPTARVALRAAPWELEAAGGFTAADAPFTGAAPFALAHLGLGRENPVNRYQVDAIALSIGESSNRAAVSTFGVSASTDLNRVRIAGEGSVQPTSAGLAWLAGGRAGYALGDDNRVVLSALADTLSGGDEPAFTRPMADTHLRFGWLGRWDDTGDLAGSDALDAGGAITATIAPQLRLEGQALHLWTGGAPLGPEIDADLKWYWSPLATLHLRGSALRPWSEADPVRIATAVTLDVDL